jgi:DNA-binding NarL/FixJ family response regulator
MKRPIDLCASSIHADNVSGMQPYMGAEAASELLRCRARCLGLRPRHRPRSTLDMKTSEVRIASLIRVGKTNAEIGDQLGLSTRTVEHYVSNMLSKFGVRFRAQIQ